MNRSKMKEKSNFTGMEIAVIGMAGRFPGANNVDAFWDNLKNGIDSGYFYSDEELLEAGVDKSLINHPNYVKSGNYIEGKEYFDSNFFGYLPAEAAVMDPQIRIFHECVWEALEDSGYDPEIYDGSIGLYVGAGDGFFWQAYSTFMTGDSDNPVDPLTVNQLRKRDFIATLVSYRLNLKGPAVFIHTACSTSLVAIHMACRGLLTGDSHIALAGGVTLNPQSNAGYIFQEGMILSSDGCCRAFDAEAKGTVGGEGAAVVVLKRLKKAIADRDNIMAIVKGSAINNDGLRKISYSAPSEDGQVDALQTAHLMARVEPQSISYIEAHGTGTVLGDPIEMEALTQAFGKSKEKYCAVGSVKTNIGHLDTAAGAAGFIKTVLALKHRQIPPSLHFKTPNPRIDFENSPFYVNTELREWKNNKYPLRAGVSSFGIGGTNAHVVLEEWRESADSSERGTGRPQLLLLSAKTQLALDKMTENLARYLEKNPAINLANAAYTLQVGRRPFPYRRKLIGSNLAGTIEKLSSSNSRDVQSYPAHAEEAGKNVIFMFPGLGPQYVNMGLGLYQTEPLFREQMDRCFEILKPLIGYNIKEVLYPSSASASSDRINQFEIAQLVIFVFEYALAKLLINWGIKPGAMIGYSFGEYVSACVSGVFSLEDILRLLVTRGKLISGLSPGMMLSVPLPAEEVHPLLPGELSIGIDNGSSCLVSGPLAAVKLFEKRMKEKKLLCTLLESTHAIHSQMMDPILEKFEMEVGKITLEPPRIPYISTVTGDWLRAEDAVSPAYWAKQLRSTVYFAGGIQKLLKEANTIFLEVGPGRDISALVNREIDGKSPHQAVVNLVKHRTGKKEITDEYYLLDKIGLLWLFGVNIDWQAYHSGEKPRRISLPTYPFEKIKYPANADIDKLVSEVGARRLAADDRNWQTPTGPDDGNKRQQTERVEGAAPVKFERLPLSTPYREPSTPTEKTLVEIWEKFFNIDKVGIDDDFYDLGGDSLKAMSLANIIHKVLNVRVSLAEFFDASTIRELAAYINASQKETFAAVEKAEKKEYYILSSAQKRLYFIQQMIPGSTAYNLPQVVPLKDSPDREQLERVFKQIIRRHESFRTSFLVIEGEPVQRIHEDVEFEIEYISAEQRAESVEFKEKNVEPYTAIQNFVRSFDLSEAPLLRAGLAAGTAGGTPILLVDMHHIISDASSLNIIEKEFKALLSGEQLPEVPLQYKDHAEWQNSEKQKRAIKKQEDYWLKNFEGELPILHLPFDYPRPAVQRFEGATVNFFISKEKTSTIKETAKSFDTTLFILLLAAYNILLSRLSGQEDIIVGVPIEGRRYLELKHTIGMFVNTLPIRNYPSLAKGFKGFLQEVKQSAATAFENQDYPFEDLVEKLEVKRDTSRNPVFDVALNLVSLWEFSNELPESEADRGCEHQAGNSKFDLTFTFIDVGSGLSFSIEYCTKLFKPATIERFIGYFKKIVSCLSENPEVRLAEIDILGEEEKQQLLIDFNQTAAEYPGEKTITALFAAQVEQTPDNVALVGNVSVTYAELNLKSNQVAHALKEKGVLADSIVGIKMERSVEMIIGILGIMKAGGAYLPIDPDYPQERIDFMLKDSGARILLTDLSEGHHFHHSSFITHHSGNLAYIIYTSGSTGWPKGVVTTHGNVIPVVKNTNYIQLDKTDRLLQLSNYAFDGSVFDIFGALLNGAALVLVETGTLLDVLRLSEFIKRQNITVFFVTTALFNTLVTLNIDCFTGVRKVLFGGERVSVPHVARAFDHLGTNRILHMYGPTETTVYATSYFVAAVDSEQETIPIGKPLSNTTVYILDLELNPVPIGVPGEMYIGGPGVAPGYLNHPELTAEWFCNYRSYRSYRTYSLNFSKKLYKTGDLARWLPDGNIEFIGRIDLQVKIRGFRIEPGEIEKQLLEMEEITEALVIPGKVENGEKYLCAYVVTAKEMDISVLRNRLSFSLPDYMIPSYFMPVEKIPLTPNGKIDHKQLPKPEIVPGADYVGPRDETEERIVDMWSEVLGIEKEKIGVTADFFELGGHSLKATTLAARIHKGFDTDIPLEMIFRKPTVRGLARYISDASKTPFISIQPVEKREYYELSSTQVRLFVIQQMEIDNVVYNVPLAVVLEGELDKTHLEDTIGKLIKRHESLRTSFGGINQEPVQRVREDVEFKIEYYSVEQGAKAVIQDFIRPFDLSKAPLLRVGLFQVEKHRHVLIMDMHHIITDGSSQAILSKEFMELYAGKEPKPLRIQYRDYARWQKDQKEKLKEQEEYWLNVFETDVPVLNLPTDYPRPAVQSFEGSTFQFSVDRENTGQLRKAAANHGATLYTVLLAIFNVLLAKLSGQEDIVVGAPIAGRRHAELEHMVGMFVNTLALRNSPSPGKTVDDFLKEVKEQTLEAFENQEYQFEDLVEQVQVNRDVGRNPLFDVVFILQNVENPILEIPGLTLRPYEYETSISKFDLTLTGFEAEESLLFSWEYCTKLFKKETIERFSGYFALVISEIVTDPGKQLAEIEIISDVDKNRILYDFNNTSVEYPGDKTIHELFEEQAEKRPDGAAVIGHRGIHITYRELNQKTNQVAHSLREKGVLADSIIGIKMERSVEMIIGILGISKAGGGYLPIDPDYPQERIDYMLKDSNAVLLLTSEELSDAGRGTRFCAPTTCNLHLSLAYVIYTSGSTGRPKGVMVEQRNVIRLVKNTNYIKFRENEKLLQTGALEFDASTFEIWGPLLNGLSLYLAHKEEILDAERLKTAIRKYDIGIMWLTSPFFNRLSGVDVEIFAGLRNLLVGGDVLSPVHINRVRKRFPGLNIINGYGPTENTTFSTTFLITTDYRERIPIGKPIANSTAYIVDRCNQLVPIGVVGELCVGGDGAARGYLNNPELTAEKFVDYRTYSSKKVYKTGDLARWLVDGNIEFLGRIDFQVKIRGFRIEPGEIEKRLLEIEDIAEALVIPIEVENQVEEKYLCAYIVSAADAEIDISGLRQRLSISLVDYMVPSYFIPIEKIPLTPNGKVDRKQLPIPEILPGADYIGPQEEVEEKLVDIWSEVLTVPKEKISVKADFFELGGHSLKAVVMSSRIHKEFNVKIPLVEIFRKSTIRELAGHIRKSGAEQFVSIEPVEEKDFYPLSPAQKRLYILQHMQRNNLSYNMPSVVLLEGMFDRGKLEKAIKKLINRHENLRTSFEMMERQPIQRIHGDVDFAAESYEKSEEEAKPLIDTFVRPFDLDKVPLLRMRLIKIGQTRQLLMYDMHHIISDGTSMSIFIREFMALYEGKELPPLRIQYKDFSQWQNTRKRIEIIKKQEKYWLGEFKGDVPLLNLPIDYERPKVQTSEGNTISFEIDSEATALLKEIALEEGATLYMVLLAIFNVLLSKECNQENTIIGAPTAGRRHTDLEPLIGFFINMLALRNFPHGRKTFREFLLEVKQKTLNAYENQDYQFEELVDKVLKDRESGRNSLIDVIFVFQNMVIMAGEIPEVTIPELTLKSYDQDIGFSPFDLILHGHEAGEKLSFFFQYRTTLFKEETMRTLIRNFEEVVSTVIDNKNIRLQDIKISYDLLALESASLHEEEGDFEF